MKTSTIGKHICLGVSPFNSQFSEDYIADLIELGQSGFESFHLFVPDWPTTYTLKAMGYDDRKINQKMKKQFNWLYNKIERAFERHGFNQTQAQKRILNWDRLSKDHQFINDYERTLQLFKRNTLFRAACMKASTWVLEGKIPESEMTIDRLEIAVQYLLAEIPVFIGAGKLSGQMSSVFCYHQKIPFIEQLFADHFELKPYPNQLFGVIQTAQAGPLRIAETLGRLDRADHEALEVDNENFDSKFEFDEFAIDTTLA